MKVTYASAMKCFAVLAAG